VHRSHHQDQPNICQCTCKRENQATSRAEIRPALPQAACFVVPNISSIDEYRSARRTANANWANLKKREQLAIFLPNDVSQQEVRDCPHEELA